MTSMTTVRLDALGKIVTGSTPPAAHPEWFAANGVPFLTPSDLIDNQRRVRTQRFLSEVGAREMAKRLIPENAICFVSIGSTIGKMCSTTSPSVTNQQINSLVVDESIADPIYIYYAISQISERLRAIAGGSATPILNKTTFASIELEVLPLPEQRAIAATLGALDDKIESNRRAIRSAMALAEALYQRVAALACKKRLGDHSTLVLGGTPSRKRAELWEGGTVPWIASGAANADIVMEPTEFITQAALDGSAAKIMPKGATVLAITGATLGQVALLGISTSGNQSLVGVWGETESTTGWLHFALRASVEELVKSATGAAQQHVNKGNVGDLMVPIPGPEELQAWSEVCVPLIERAIQLSAESRNLSTMRDALLPELLSGRIRAADVEVA